MYVADVTDLNELRQLLAEAEDRVQASRTPEEFEQAQWDIEDIEDRIDELTFEARFPKLIKLMNRPSPFAE